MQPKKSSKMWIWVLGILGLLALLCGGGGIGALVIYKASLRSERNYPTPSPAPTQQRGTPTATPTPFSSDDVQDIDLANWVRKDSTFGNTSFKNGEFFMSSKKG